MPRWILFFFWTVGKSVADMMTLLNTLAYVCAFSYNDLLTFFFYIFVVNICSNLLLASDSSLVFLRWWHAMPCQHPDHGAIWHGTDWGGSPALLWACTQASRAGRGLQLPSGKLVWSHMALITAQYSAQPQPQHLSVSPRAPFDSYEILVLLSHDFLLNAES